MSGYTKLDSSLVTSTVWAESLSTKVVWITMLALSDADGLVDATVPGLARIAGVTLDECRCALTLFLAPDPDSRSQEHEGRRVERVGGVFRLLNYAKYRYKNSQDWKKEQDAAKHRNAYGRQRENAGDNGRTTGDLPQSPDQSPAISHQAEAEAEAEAEETKEATTSSELETAPAHEPTTADDKQPHSSALLFALPPPMTLVPVPTSPVVAVLPCVGAGPSEYPVTEALVAEWSASYPGIDARREVLAAIQWCRDNPRHRKTVNGARRYLGSWLARAQDRGGGGGRTVHRVTEPASLASEFGNGPQKL